MIAPRDRPSITKGLTFKYPIGCGVSYITVNEDDKGVIEVFIFTGKAGGCSTAQNEAIGRLISVALRSGVKIESVIKHLKGIRCPQPYQGNGMKILSCSDAIGQALEKYMALKTLEKMGGHQGERSNSFPSHKGDKNER